LHCFLVLRSILGAGEEKLQKTSRGGALGGRYFLPAPIFEIFKNHILAPRPLKMSSDKKVMKTKNLPFDKIYLEHGLRFELQPQIGALGPKNAFLAFYPICQIPSCHS
jgi:hypothetical protein